MPCAGSRRHDHAYFSVRTWLPFRSDRSLAGCYQHQAWRRLSQVSMNQRRKRAARPSSVATKANHPSPSHVPNSHQHLQIRRRVPLAFPDKERAARRGLSAQSFASCDGRRNISTAPAQQSVEPIPCRQRLLCVASSDCLLQWHSDLARQHASNCTQRIGRGDWKGLRCFHECGQPGSLVRRKAGKHANRVQKWTYVVWG